MQETIEQFDNPAHLSVTCPAEFTQSRVLPLREVYARLVIAFTDVRSAEDGVAGRDQFQVHIRQFCTLLIDVAHRASESLLHALATAHVAPNDVSSGSIASHNILTD